MISMVMNAIDVTASLLWMATLQWTLFAVLPLVAIACWSRRPAVRHMLALAVLIAAVISPLSAMAARSLNLCWVPIPGWLVPASGQIETVPSPAIDAWQPDPALPVSPLADLRSEAVPPEKTPLPAIRPESPPAKLIAEQTKETPRVNSEVASPAHRDPVGRKPDVVVESGPAKRTPLPDNPAIHRPWRSIDVLRDLFGIWLVGFAYCIARTWRLRSQLRQLLRRASVVTDARVSFLLQNVSETLGLRQKVELLSSPCTHNPFVMGVIQPRVIVPEALLTLELESQLRHVLLHELSHVSRGDLWIGFLQRWAISLFWFHPLIYLYNTVLSQAREELCDNQVLSIVPATDYARTLLQMSEKLSGLAAPAALALFSRGQTLESRIAALLEPKRDRAVRLQARQYVGFVMSVVVLGIGVAGIGPQTVPRTVAAEPPGKPAAETATVAVNSPDRDQTEKDLIDRIRQRVSYFLQPPQAVQSLEYELSLRGEPTEIQVKQGERRRLSVWQGATLYAGVHALLQSPDIFDIQLERKEGADTFLVRAAVKPGNKLSVQVGNGVENSWGGYFSHPAIQTAVTVDAKRLVPLKEETRDTTITYHDWQEVEPGSWVPQRIEVIRPQTHFRMHFDWLGKSIWMLRYFESFSAGKNTLLGRVRNVRINGQPAPQPMSESELKSQAGINALLDVVDHNRPWLDAGTAGAGWQPPFDTLSYTFQTAREDVVESCVLDRNGESVVEITRDGQGKLGDRFGARHVALNTQEYAITKRGMSLAAIHGRPKSLRDQPFDLALKKSARIGCNFDLPLFRYRAHLPQAKVEWADGEWNGVACQKATVTDGSRNIFLGCGTMLGFCSWSYLHHIQPTEEILYIDPGRKVPLHETLKGANKTFEIDFGEYIEVTPGQFAPLSIRIESPGYFTCEYRFQIVGKTHWMLQEVVSWFDEKEKSRGTVQDIQINGKREILDDALRQVAVSRPFFAGEGQPREQIHLAGVPFAVGENLRLGAYDVRVSLSNPWKVIVKVSAGDRTSPRTVPVCFLDAQHHLLLAPSVTLAEKDDQLQGQLEIRASHIWQDVKFVATSTAAPNAANALPVQVIPFRWNEPLAINVAHAQHNLTAGKRMAYLEPTDQMRAFRVQVDRQTDGSARAKVDLMSVSGLREAHLDIALAVVGSQGQLLSTGHLATTQKILLSPMQQQFEIGLEKWMPDQEPKFLILGVSPGNILGQPMGSQWFTYLSPPSPFTVETLLASSDEGCWSVALDQLSDVSLYRDISNEFFREWADSTKAGNPPRLKVLTPRRDALRRIVSAARRPEVIAAASRLLAYSEDDLAGKLLEPLVTHESAEVRYASMIGLTFLKRDAYLGQLRELLEQTSPPRELQSAARNGVAKFERDALIALLHQGSDRAIDALGATLLKDLQQLKVATNEKQKAYLQGRPDRARDLCKLLGHSENGLAADHLLSADRFLSEQPEISAQFARSDLLNSLSRFAAKSDPHIIAAIESGKSADEWLHVIRGSTNPVYIPATRVFLKRDDTTPNGTYYAVRYLANFNSPDALAGLRECYDRGLHATDTRLRMTISEALAAAGDPRGLKEAFELIVNLQHAAEPPSDERERRQWQRTRDNLREQATKVATTVPKAALQKFLLQQTDVTSIEQQRVVIDLLWTLPTLPTEIVPTARRWSESTDEQVARSAKRLLERE